MAKNDNGDTSCFYHGDFMGKSFTFDSRCGLRGVIHFILAKKRFITACRLVRSCHAQICYNYIIVCSRTLTPFRPMKEKCCIKYNESVTSTPKVNCCSFKANRTESSPYFHDK